MLETHQLSCIRDDWTLFSGLSFRLEPAQALLIEGPNGSGKTSLLRILCGMRLPDAGKVTWNQEDILSSKSDYKNHTAYLGHKDGIKLDLTAQENLSIARVLGNSRRKTEDEDALNQLKLSGYYHTPARNMSAGQRRRLALARLLITGPKLWILDEPFTSLDQDGITIVETLVNKHLAEGGMLALTSHHPVNIEETFLNRISLQE